MGTGSVIAWNRWYDRLPSEWRFQFILWPFIALGAVNLLLTFSSRFPFGLLLLLGFIFVAAIRVPYMLGTLIEPQTETAEPRLQFEAPHWMTDLNQRYEAMSDSGQVWTVTGILLIAGLINMLLTINDGFPFGLLFLLVLLAIVAVRAPFANGWIKQSQGIGEPVPSLDLTLTGDDRARSAITEATVMPAMDFGTTRPVPVTTAPPPAIEPATQASPAQTASHEAPSTHGDSGPHQAVSPMDSEPDPKQG